MLVEHRSAEMICVLHRLQILQEQIRALAKSIEQDARCEDVLAQLAGVRGELVNVAMTIVETRFREAVSEGLHLKAPEVSVIRCRTVMKYAKR